MKIICLEGCHGVGKTTVINDLQLAGQTVLDEMFIDMPSFKIIANQSLTMETLWVAKWFGRLLELFEKNQDKLLFADRSPYSALYYSKCSKTDQQTLKELIDEQIRQMKEVGIEIITLCIQVEREALWQRILTRLSFEPIREKYNEGSREWMDLTANWYDGFSWDFVVNNTEDVVPRWRVLDPVLQKLGVALK